jgi:hypothetical protein
MSYRRANMPWALAVYENLTAHHYDVFFDYESILSGDFEQVILGNIRARAHFIVLLTPSALDRCDKPDDWLRREIETALDEKRNIVPIFLEGFSFGDPSVSVHLTGRLADLSKYNGLDVPDGYFKEAMSRLRTRFLDVPLDTVLHPIPVAVQEAVAKQQRAATNAAAMQEKAPDNVRIGQARIKIILNPWSDPTIVIGGLFTSYYQSPGTLTLDGKQISFNQNFLTESTGRPMEIFNELMDVGEHEIYLKVHYSPSISQKFSVSNGQTATATIFLAREKSPSPYTKLKQVSSLKDIIRWKISIEIEPKFIE